ncbi:hypothetical protein F3I27_12650 [Pantoea sp. Bo_2]|uniref:hypothetical protein n=1 Tax=unclassified Pantoea TaxID=2630326 RepID=UPI001231BF73|nr:MULTISPECIES: hypothetical protein [unclassified Pantoea]KAA5936434.1 hypothetical protein F3I57_22555 [Pantoea sp. VH_3]KAA5949702.1 hypothetical protein F3I56_17630 [Pantoea sp. VH_25]KAA5955428.1 hypothetical protein F3I55_12690 [Pantoea sp. VH_24]KAA5958951.1 hypothetical protein F3I53_13560 [Pantoea sp. VH_16]KAA5964149.1 hypothetical protein F3I54_13400 [Pantoea sp. VH_18]
MINSIRVKYIGNQFAHFETGNGITGLCHVDERSGATTVLLNNAYILGVYKNQFAATDAIHDLCEEIHYSECRSGECRKARRTSSVTIIGIELPNVRH